MPCTGRYATAVQFAQTYQFGGVLTAAETTQIEAALDLSASNIHAVLAAANACSCALASWATTYLAKINCIEAAVLTNAPCIDPNLTVEQKRMLMDLAGKMLEAIRTGEIDVCEGATGKAWPALGFAEIGWDSSAIGQIIANRLARTP